MADAVLSFVLEQFSTFLRDESALSRGVRDEIQHIKDELGQMKGFLRIGEATIEDNSDLKEWISQLRDVAYDAEDVLDEFIMRSGRNYSHGYLGRVRKVFGSIRNLKFRRQLATKIQTIKDRIENISVAHRRYQYEQGSSSVFQNHNENSWYDSRGDALFVEEEDLVGIERSKKKLMDMLFKSDSELHVISIVGMGGLGKTTLVKKVYDNAVVKSRIKHHVWVAVSQTFKIETLLRDTIQQLIKERKQFGIDELDPNQPIPHELDRMDINSLKQHIRDLLHRENYILVFDDIWRTTDWDAIRMAFPRNNCGSRIVITTRINEVGLAAGSDIKGFIYHLKPLSEEESWTLFCKKAFQATCPHHLEDISGKIIERCAGLPLANVVIGGVLATKSRRTEEWELFNRSLGEQLAGNNQLDNMTKLLTLSYYNLPDHLKICFLYLSILPEDVFIEKNRLIRLWIAEGFVQNKERMTIEEVAEGYLNELINRSLVQVADTTIDGRVKVCRIHDITQQIILRKAREHNITVILSEGLQLPDKVRRLVIHSLIDNTRVSKDLLKCLRSLVLFESIESITTPFLSKLLSNDLRLLKVLDLRGSPLEAIPHQVVEFLQLKYLSLRNTKVEVVPKLIGKLRKLEILDLRYTNVRELPVEILKLQQLRHLLVGDKNSGFQAPYEIGKLKSLQSLHNIDADQMGDTNIVKEIGKLTQLRKLGITNLKREDGSELRSSLEKLTNLRSLRVISTNIERVIDLDYSLSSTPRFLRKLLLAGQLEKTPRWILSLHGLTTITLSDTRLSDDPLHLLQHLPNLMHLILDLAYEGEGLCFKAGGFQRLKMLQIWKLYSLRWVRVEKGAMPFLHILIMGNCESLKQLPTGIEHLTSLQILEFCNMSGRFMRMLEDIDKQSADYKNIAQIPRVKISSWSNGRLKRHYLSMEMEKDM